ncbi:MAG: hypothetical protein MJZ60_10750 [Bacteroidaceae bacterium]|nr:hypothetical protein [Bacteroidaceae bacterium]
MKKIYYVWLLFFVIATACARAGSLQGKTVLFVYGGWDGHDPKDVERCLYELLMRNRLACPPAYRTVTWKQLCFTSYFT